MLAKRLAMRNALQSWTANTAYKLKIKEALHINLGGAKIK